MRQQVMRERAQVGGGTIAYRRSGSGEPILLVHGGLLVDGALPLADELAARHAGQVIYIHRRGFGASSPPEGLHAMGDWAADVVGVLDHLGIDRADIVGHSIGGAIAVQLALDAPSRVRGLILLEPPLPSLIPSGPQLLEGLSVIRDLADAGDRVAAVEAGLSGVFGPDYRADIERALPSGAIEQAVKDVDTFASHEIEALTRWRLTDTDLGSLRLPVLSVRGSDTLAAFAESDGVLAASVPGIENISVPGATHALSYTHATVAAAHIAAFLARRK